MAAAALVFTHELRQPLLMRVRVRVRVRVRAKLTVRVRHVFACVFGWALLCATGGWLRVG